MAEGGEFESPLPFYREGFRLAIGHNSWLCQPSIKLPTPPGFGPGRSESKSDMQPLHHGVKLFIGGEGGV